MKYILSFLALFTVFITTMWQSYSFSINVLFNGDGNWNQIPYCNEWDECWLRQWVDAVNNIQTIENNRTFSQYVQDIAIYILNFLAFIAIFVIIYAWFNMLLSLWDEEKAKKSKKMITYAILWLIIIYIAWPLIDFVTGILNT